MAPRLPSRPASLVLCRPRCGCRPQAVVLSGRSRLRGLAETEEFRELYLRTRAPEKKCVARNGIEAPITSAPLFLWADALHRPPPDVAMSRVDTSEMMLIYSCESPRPLSAWIGLHTRVFKIRTRGWLGRRWRHKMWLPDYPPDVRR